MNTVAEAPTWDLRPLLFGREEACVDDLLSEALCRARLLAAQTDAMCDDEPEKFARMMSEAGSVLELLGRVQSYASLRHAADTSDAVARQLLESVESCVADAQISLAVVEQQWVATPERRAQELLTDGSLRGFSHYLTVARRHAGHLLDEREEQLLAEKTATGIEAWVRLFQTLSGLPRVRVAGTQLCLEEALGLLASADRNVRSSAASGITSSLINDLPTRTSVFNAVLHDRAIEDRLRGYPHWLASRNLSNEVTDASVEATVGAARRRYDLPRRWYRLKAQLLGLPVLSDYDRMAPLAVPEVRIPWRQAQSDVLQAFASFSQELADRAERLFAEGRIDAAVRSGKRAGAFCDYTVPSSGPFVLLSYTGQLRDVLTLAHELGHALHATLAAEQGVFHYVPPLGMAETAAIFSERLVIDKLMEGEKNPQVRLALAASSLDGVIETTFRSLAMHQFEHEAHTERRREGELSSQRLGELWMGCQHEVLGDAVQLTPGFASWWSLVPHFVEAPGSTYAYPYGQLMALSMHEHYQQAPDVFMPRYLAMLSAGGSLSPPELARMADCDLEDTQFWSRGLSLIERELSAVEDAAREAGQL
jgi:oligoendopeptidase F